MRRLNVYLMILAALFSVNVVAGEVNGFSTDGSDERIIRTYNDIGNFDAISSNVVGDIYFTQTTDGSSSMRVIGESKYVEAVKVVVLEGVLTINGSISQKSKSGKRVRMTNSADDSKLRIEVSAPALKLITQRGVGDVKIEKGLRVANLTLNNKGVGDVKINSLKVGTLSVTLTGVGDVQLSGKADKATLTVTGVGDIESYGLEVANLSVVSRGVGDVQCHATKSINAECRGVGGISYKGSPKEKQIISKGIGSVKRKN